MLVANVVSMRDARGGWKALDTAFLRDHLHAATAVGRMAAAAKAVELGYGIQADGGPSGRLGGWAIAGIPKPACEVHSTRAAQIDRAVGRDGSYRARAVAARATRDRKSHDTVEDLVGRWRDELTRAGYPPVEVDGRVREAGLKYRPPGLEVLDRVAEELLGPGGPLAQNKSFTRGDVIVAAAPLLHGLPVSVLDEAVSRVLGHDLAVALPVVVGGGEPVWAAASVLADERRIAELAERLTAATGSKVDPGTAAGAVSRFETAAGMTLTDTQRAVAVGLVASDRRLDVVVGVAGSGKTTTLAAVRAGLEEAGYEVIGAATSGQAARTLGSGAGIESRTVASLSWRLDHGQIRLTDRHVLILDEAGMTTDADIGRLLTAVDRAGARAVVVGDYHQLDAVGPGGALEAITARHPEAVHALGDNLRQIDPAERAALDQLRAGSVDAAVGWYGSHGRVHPAATRAGAVYGMVNAWAADVAAGKESLLLAYRRDNVAALNYAARQAWRALGRLDGLELHAGDGRVFQAGDRIITLAPGPNGQWTTSQRATVTAVDVDQRTLTAATPEGNELRITGEYLAAHRIGYGYAITVHRSQGATVDTAHVLADGGGRELAYVAMSRARGQSHVHTIGTGPSQAAERLAWEWQHSRRQTWTPQVVDPAELAELRRQRYQLRDSIPPDVRHQLAHARGEHDRYREELDDLYTAQGRWANHPAGQAAAAYHHAHAAHQHAQERADDPSLGWWARRKAGQELATATEALEQAAARWQRDGAPVAANYLNRLDHLDSEITRLEASEQQRRDFLERHPDLPDRVAELDNTICELETQVREQRRHQLDRDPDLADSLWPGRHHGVSQEPDLGMGL